MGGQRDRAQQSVAILVVAALTPVFTPPAAASARSEKEARLSEIYVQGMSGGTPGTGTYGFLVKPMKSKKPVLDLNNKHVFDPASALKALPHL